jgi:hypothetical protein
VDGKPHSGIVRTVKFERQEVPASGGTKVAAVK